MSGEKKCFLRLTAFLLLFAIPVYSCQTMTTCAEEFIFFFSAMCQQETHVFTASVQEDCLKDVKYALSQLFACFPVTFAFTFLSSHCLHSPADGPRTIFHADLLTSFLDIVDHVCQTWCREGGLHAVCLRSLRHHLLRIDQPDGGYWKAQVQSVLGFNCFCCFLFLFFCLWSFVCSLADKVLLLWGTNRNSLYFWKPFCFNSGRPDTCSGAVGGVWRMWPKPLHADVLLTRKADAVHP